MYCRSLLSAVAAVSLLLAPARADGPKKVVSLNLCTDLLLMALADREQIASITYQASDPSWSVLSEEAATLPANRGSGEAILMDGADLVLAGPYDGLARRGLLEAHGVPVMVLPPWTSLAEGREQIMAIAARLGHRERGEALIAAIDAALAHAKDAAPAPRTILVMQRRGWVPGGDSMVGELLRHVGLTPFAAALGLPDGGVVRLERVVATPPDYALINESATGAIDNGTAFLVHPALAAAIPPERRLRLANKFTICGGPATPAAIDALVADVRAKVR